MQLSSCTSLIALGALSLGLPLAACSSASSTVKGDASGHPHTEAGVDTGGIVLPPKDAGADATLGDAAPDAPIVVHHPDTGVDAEPPLPTDAEATKYPAFVASVPQVQSYGGPVLTSPLFVPVFFKGDTDEPRLEQFVQALGPSSYWNQVVSEYGVGAGMSAPPIILDETMPPTIDDTQIQIWLQNRIGSNPAFLALGPLDAGTPDAGHADGGSGGESDAGVSLDANAPLSKHLSPTATAPDQAIYLVFTPAGTTVTEGGSTSCTGGGFLGYHFSTTYGPNGSTIVYAIVPHCTAGNDDLMGFNVLTASASHELVEAATDPIPYVSPAYITVDNDHFMWASVYGGGEVGDMCQATANAYINPTEAALSMFTVQRIWSNAAALAGHDPCRPTLPASQEPFYFNSVPNMSPVTLQNSSGQQFTTLAIVAHPNVPTTVEIDLFSDAPTDGMEWTVSAASPYNGGVSDLVFTHPMGLPGSNGYKLNFTVTNLSNDGQVIHPFIVSSNLGSLDTNWIGAVSDQ